MKPFDLEKAKAGAPVCTRTGIDVKLLKFDFSYFDETYILASIRIEANNIDVLLIYNPNGTLRSIVNNSVNYEKTDVEIEKFTLFMKPNNIGYARIYKYKDGFTIGSEVLNTEEEAMEINVISPSDWEFAGIATVEW